MIPILDIERARSRLVDVIGAEVALKPSGRELKGLCVFHNEKTPSLYVIPDKGFFTCFGCGAHGDAIGFVMRLRNLDFAEAVRFLLGMPEQVAGKTGQFNPRPPRANDERTLDRVRAILRESTPIAERTPAWLYLWSRGLKLDQRALRAHPGLYCHEVGKPLPALIAPILDGEGGGEPVALQRIWVNDRLEYAGGNGPQDARAALQTRKKGLGHQGGGAVRLAPAGPVLGLAEGVESAVAASMLYRCVCWSTCGAARLGRVYIPDIVQSVIVFGDNGATGHALAEAALELLAERGFPATAVFPDPQFGDFNDQIIGRRAA